MYLKQLFLFFIVLLFSACEEERVTEAGSHYQNIDCLLCHNGQLTADKHLTYGGTLYLDNASAATDFSKMCKEQVYIQMENGGTVSYDGRDTVQTSDSGALGKGNLYLEKSIGNIPTGSYNMRLILGNGTLLAKSGIHQFNGTYNTLNSADTNNRYSCNACHSTSPTGGASGLMVVDQNLSLCLQNNTDVPVTTFFAGDTFPILENYCGSCHNLGQAGATASNFDLDSSNIGATRTNTLTWLVNTINPSASVLVNCPADANHTVLEVCSQTGDAYNRVIEWITLE